MHAEHHHTPASKAPAFPHPAEFVTDIQLAARYAVSRQTVWRWAKEGRLPAPIKLGPNCTRWRFADVVAKLEGAA